MKYSLVKKKIKIGRLFPKFLASIMDSEKMHVLLKILSLSIFADQVMVLATSFASILLT
jgi:hypothetical protein